MCGPCEALTINGVLCHEIGCPEAGKGPESCAWCGAEFLPEYKGQKCCTNCCAEAYN